MKNPGVTLLGLVLLAVAIKSVAVLPPKYLEVEGFQQCLAEQQVGSYSVWCMPDEKPDFCSVESWKKLFEFSGNDRLPDCRAAAIPPRSLPAEQ